MRPITTTVGPLATPGAASVAVGQAVSGPGPININGSAAVNGVAAFANPAHVVIYDSDVSSPVYRIEGRDPNGRPFGETLVATASPATSVNLFSAVTNVYVSRALSSALVVGNDNGGAGQPIRLDEWADAPLGCQVVANGTVNFTVQHSFDDPNDPVNPVPFASMFWDSSLVPAAAVGGTTSLSFAIPTAPSWMRLLVNSGTGSARLTVSQYNVVEV